MIKDPKLITLSVGCALAGATIISIMVIPMYWHKRPAEPAARPMSWPEEALRPPSTPAASNTLETEFELMVSAPPSHTVKTEHYVLVTPIMKSPEPKAPVQEPEHDICQRDGGYKVVVHHGRGWRCRYPRRR